MQVILTTKFQRLSELVDSVSTSYKIQVTAGRVLALESTTAPEPSSSNGNSFGLGEFFTSTAEQGDLYVRGTTSQTTINVVPTSSFSAGISPFTGATGTTDGGGSGGGSDSAAQVKVKYESNPNTNAFTDDEKEKLSKLSELSFEISGITHNYNNNQLTTSITDTNGTVTSNSVTIEAGETDDVTSVSMDIVDGTISTTLTKESGSIVSSIPVVLPESNEVKEVANTIASGQLKTSITLTDDTIIESTPVALPTGGGSGGGVTPEQLDAAIAGANEYADQGDASTLLSAEFLAVGTNALSIENGKLKSTISQVDGTDIESNEVVLPTGGSVNIDAPDNTVVKVIGGELVASGVIEENGSIKVAPSSIEIGAHKLSSIGDSLGVKNLATDQQRALLFQDITGGVAQRPYVYKMASNEWENTANIPNTDGEVTKDSQSISGYGVDGYYIIKSNSLYFETGSPVTDFIFTIYDFDKKIFERKYTVESATEHLLDHDAIILDGAAEISFSVTDLDRNPIALKGQTELNVQRFAFIVRNAERAYLAYEGEGGSGGEYPKNPTFETVQLDMFAGSDAKKNINFLSDDLTITNREDGKGILLEAENITFKTGEVLTSIDADELDVGFREIINAQSGNKATSLTTLAQVESMLKNLFLRKEEVTLNDNILELDSNHAGKNVFVSGSGLNSGLRINSENFDDYQVIQITRSSGYANPAIPLTIAEGDSEARYLVQGTTTFGVYDGHWMILSDATVTLSEISQRAGFQQYVSIRAGQGMTSAIDQFGVMTLNVVGGGGGGNPSFEIPDNTVPVIVDKLPVSSAISVEFDQLIAPYGQIIAGHIMDSRGEVLAVNNHSSVTQPIDNIGRYSNPKIFKEVDVEQPSTFINTNMHNEGIVHPNGQEIVVHSEDYIWIRTEPDTLHFRAGKIFTGYVFSVLDQTESLIYQYKSSDTHNSNDVVHIKCPSLTLRANKSYRFIVTDLNGNPLTLLGSGDVQSWVFDYSHLTQHELLTDQDSVLPDTATFMHVKTLQVTDHTESSGLTFNSNGTLEVSGQINMQNQHILELSAAEHDHEATNLGQVKSLIANADFTGTISIDGQPVEDIQLNENDFIYSYNEFTKVLHLNTKNNGGGGGSGTADGTVNPIISENLMTGYLVEFATDDGKFIRSSNVKWSDIQSEHERIWDKLEPAYKTSITAQTEAAANTLSISHTQHNLSQLERKVTHNRLTNDDQALRISELQIEDARQDKHINTLDIDHQSTRTTVNNHQVEIESLTADYATLQGQQETTTADLTALDAQVTTIASFPLERIAAGEFEETLSIADSFDTLSSTSSHYLTPIGAEVEYHLPPDARTVEPNYTIKLKVDGIQHEALKLTTTAIKAGMKPIKDVLDGVDAQDAATINQLVPINEAISKIHERLNVIEAQLGIISPPPDQFIVYKGRMIEHITTNAALIKALDKVENITANTLLTTDLTIAGHIEDAEHSFSYSVIAYPKGVVNPDPLNVSYEIFPKATREHYEIVIDGVMYIVLVPEYPDSSANPITYKLVQ